MPRKTVRFVAKLLVGAMFFAQTALALAACEAERRAPALAITAAEHAAAAEHCHESEGNANLCLAHCLAGDQASDGPSLFVPAFAAESPAVPQHLASTVPIVPQRSARAQGATPRHVLFQRFLI